MAVPPHATVPPAAALLAVVCLALSGCALQTSQLAPSLAADAPADRLLWRAPDGADATISVVRDVGFAGAGCYYALFINKVLAARMAPGEKIDFRVASGETLLGVGRDPQGRGLCGTTFDSDVVNRETILKPGETKAFRIVAGSAGVDIRRSDF